MVLHIPTTIKCPLTMKSKIDATMSWIYSNILDVLNCSLTSTSITNGVINNDGVTIVVIVKNNKIPIETKIKVQKYNRLNSDTIVRLVPNGERITPEDIPNDERTGAEGEAIIYGSDYDRLADGFSLVLGISRDVDTPVIENTDNENDMSI